MMIVLWAFCWLWPSMSPVVSKEPLSPPGQRDVVIVDVESFDLH